MFVPVSAGKVIVLPTVTATAAPLFPAVPPATLKPVVLALPPVVAPIVALSLAELFAPHAFASCSVAVFGVLV